MLALDPNGRVVRDSGPSEGLNLRARANARVTNKKALSEIATSLLEAGQAKRIYDYLVVDISRSDLATRKKEFAWSEDDIPESMGLEAKPTTVPFSQFELESDILYQLVMSLGYRHVFLCNPNEGQNFESGADVSTNLEHRLTGFQVKEYHFDLGTGKKGSKARGEESRKAADGLPAPMWVKPLSMPALIHLVREAAKKGWSEKDFPDMSLLIAASMPQLGGTGSTFLYKPSLSVDEMNAQLSPILERTKYSAASSSSEICRILAPSCSGGLLRSAIVTVSAEPSTKLIRSSEAFSSNFWTTRYSIAWVSLLLTDIVIPPYRSLADTLFGPPLLRTGTNLFRS